VQDLDSQTFLLLAEVFEFVHDRLKRALNISLEDQPQVFRLAGFVLAEQFFKCGAFVVFFSLAFSLALCNDCPSFTFVRDDLEQIACFRQGVQPHHCHGGGRTGFPNTLVALIKHRLDLTGSFTCHNDITNFQGAVLNEQSSHVSGSLIQLSFHDCANTSAFRIGFNGQIISDKQDRFKQIIQTAFRLG